MPAISIQFRHDRKTKPWVVRYADGSSQRSSSFRTKADAQLFAAELRTDQAAGEWISPDAGRLPVASGLTSGSPPTSDGRPPRRRGPARRCGRSPATAEKTLRTLSVVMAAAVDARLIRDNPCRGVRAPRAASRHQPRFLTPGQLERLAAHVRPPYDLLVRFTAYTGLRWGEVAALRVADVDLLRGTVTVARSLERGGTVKDTKTHSRRTVHLEKALRDEVATHIQSSGLGAAGHLWTAAQGGPLSTRTSGDACGGRRRWHPGSTLRCAFTI